MALVAGNTLAGERTGALRRIPTVMVFCLTIWLSLFPNTCRAENAVLRIYDQKTGAVYVETPAEINSRLYFGWIHSLEQIPWNEYYHIDESHRLVLDAITFPAFGAGIPADKGRRCYVKDGLIHMEEIDQVFTELDWLNSHTATREITLDGVHVVSGNKLPQHTRLRLIIEKR